LLSDAILEWLVRLFPFLCIFNSGSLRGVLGRRTASTDAPKIGMKRANPPPLRNSRMSGHPKVQDWLKGCATRRLLDLTTSNRGLFLGDSIPEHRRGSWTYVCRSIAMSCFRLVSKGHGGSSGQTNVWLSSVPTPMLGL